MTVGVGVNVFPCLVKTVCSLCDASFLSVQHLVGRLIGKQGRYVSFLKQNSSAKIYISTLPYTQEFQICHIEGEFRETRSISRVLLLPYGSMSVAELCLPSVQEHSSKWTKLCH